MDLLKLRVVNLAQNPLQEAPGFLFDSFSTLEQIILSEDCEKGNLESVKTDVIEICCGWVCKVSSKSDQRLDR